MTTVRRLCPHCGATPVGCQSLHILGGRQCCTACEGNHDVSTSRERHPVSEVAPGTGIEGRERVTPFRAQTDLRDVDNHTTQSTANEGETK